MLIFLLVAAVLPKASTPPRIRKAAVLASLQARAGTIRLETGL